jgi:large subunit ribosomal protein L6
VAVRERRVSAKGPKGDLALTLPAFLEATVKEGSVQLSCRRDDKGAGATYGTMRSLVANMVTGVEKGYVKELEIHGVGFKAALQGKKLVLTLGYSHPIEFVAPDGIAIKVTDGTDISVSGPDKHLVGQVSARLRDFCRPEPYKGKGIRFKGEYVRRKVGKTVA